MKTTKVVVEFDPSIENFNDENKRNGWKIHVFTHNEKNYSPKGEYVLFKDNNAWAKTSLLRNQLDLGHAFMLCKVNADYFPLYDLGIYGDSQLCKWEVDKILGVMIIEPNHCLRESGPYYAMKTKAGSCLRLYNEWRNGSVFHYTAFSDCGDNQAEGGIIGLFDLKERMKRRGFDLFVDGKLREEVELVGDASEIFRKYCLTS